MIFFQEEMKKERKESYGKIKQKKKRHALKMVAINFECTDIKDVKNAEQSKIKLKLAEEAIC